MAELQSNPDFSTSGEDQYLTLLNRNNKYKYKGDLSLLHKIWSNSNSTSSFFDWLSKRRAKQNWRRGKAIARRLTAGNFEGGLDLSDAYYLEKLDEQHRYGEWLSALHSAWKIMPGSLNFFDWLATDTASEVMTLIIDEIPQEARHKKIDYYDAARRENLLTSFDGNKITSPYLASLSNKNKEGSGNESNLELMFAMDEENRIYTLHKTPLLHHHTSLLSGGSVRSAGYFEMNSDGELIKVSNESGHYKPGEPHLIAILEELISRNVDLSGVRVKIMSAHASAKEYNALEWLMQPESDDPFEIGEDDLAMLAMPLHR
ncbi:hypothetical protein WKR88_17655 [Trinickia caryophylli]|nr:hypothetical protein [Trinickia caryophylli]PMS14181.1 hypothetical protein C0Z17_01195 [Trinickia caryophylli]TRX17879.1 hypothetical protein FNF07_06330 [Trinickia caryophylli]WQE11351.1 hypothetical protein U0034_16595 [Trinickia caryophylli]